MSKPKTKITDEDLESMLKMFTPNDILNKFISNGSEKLTYKQLDYLFELRDGKKEEKNEK